jgi:ABC-2 type transport system permease protein
MIAALCFLMFHSWKNRLAMRIRRLKQPKYLIGALAGAVYFYLYFYRYLLGPHGASGPQFAAQNVAWLEPLGALILFTVVLLAWVIPHGRAALVFTETEVAFLFPAPVSRQSLIHFKLLKSQIRILITSLFFTLVFRRFAGGGVVWVHALGWWVILSTLNLHFMASSFIRTMLLEHGISNWKRRTLVLALVAAAATAVFVWARRTIPPPDVANFHGASDVQYYFEKAAMAGPAAYLLYPFRLVVRPYLQPDLAAFLLVVWPALLLMALHYIWVVRANVSFEEASVDASKRVAERVAAIRASRSPGGMVKPKKKKRAPFKLRPRGMAATGFLWKNLIGAGQAFTLRFWLRILVIAVVVGLVSAGNTRTMNYAMFAGSMAFMFLAMSFLIGPQLVRQDFRQDLVMADVLKTYPLEGWQVALGELLAPAVILTCLQWLLIALCLSTSAALGSKQLFDLEAGLGLRSVFAVAVAVIAPGLNFVTLQIPNAAVLLFPGWFQSGPSAPQGIEATGQRLIFALGQLVVFLIALLPAAAVFAVVYFAINYFAGIYLAVPLAALGAAIILGGEAGLGIFWLGKAFEKFDVAAEAW